MTSPFETDPATGARITDSSLLDPPGLLSSGPWAADRIEGVIEDLKALRAELAPTGSAPHAPAHDIVKGAERVLTLDDSLPTYLQELRDWERKA